ncbi:MAG: cbb3-type cytochrome c oxidase subunit 3 [Cocleimonas sp.]
MNVDDVIRGSILVLLLIAFLGMVAWAWSKKRHQDFEIMGRLPLDDDDVEINNAQITKTKER